MGNRPNRPSPMFTEEDLDRLWRSMPGCTDDEFDHMVRMCERTRLDPFARQIYAVKRWDSKAKREAYQVQVSIDGFRLVAERTGKYAGQLGPHWCGEDGEWRDVWISDAPPVAARVGVLRSDFKEPLYGVARWDSYVQTSKEGRPMAMWGKMGDLMISKCAESVALRRAFPMELSGLYTADEMAQAERAEEAVGHNEQGRPTPAEPRPSAPKPSTAPAAVVGNPELEDAKKALWDAVEAWGGGKTTTAVRNDFWSVVRRSGYTKAKPPVATDYHAMAAACDRMRAEGVSFDAWISGDHAPARAPAATPPAGGKPDALCMSKEALKGLVAKWNGKSPKVNAEAFVALVAAWGFTADKQPTADEWQAMWEWAELIRGEQPDMPFTDYVTMVSQRAPGPVTRPMGFAERAQASIDLEESKAKRNGTKAHIYEPT